MVNIPNAKAYELLKMSESSNKVYDPTGNLVSMPFLTLIDPKSR